MVNIVTSKEERELLEPIVDGIKKVHPRVTSIVNNITRRKAGVSYGEWEVLLYGRPTIKDHMGDFTFEISANSFFQTNSIQGEKLYKIARDFAEFRGDEILYDLYCGTGSTSIFMAQQVKQVYGFEVVPPAVEDAVRMPSPTESLTVDSFQLILINSSGSHPFFLRSNLLILFFLILLVRGCIQSW